MSGSLASEMMGCCCEIVRLELASRPPTLRICLASRKGCRAFSLLDLDSVFPLRTAALSGENSRICDCLSSQSSAALLSVPVRIREVDSPATGDGEALVGLRLL